MSLQPSFVLIHVADVEEGIDWYSKAFPEATRKILEDTGFVVLQLDSFSIEIVSADKKVAAGASGTVLYWYTDSWTESLARFQSLGATLYRGPLASAHC